jgi:glycosyltransferase involved in cell wall biosynthesis
MDLHPEIGRISGNFANTYLYNLLLRIDDWNCRQARPVLVHSEDMLNTLRMRPKGAEYEIQILNNFALPTEPGSSIDSKWEHDSNANLLTLIYAGNMGRFQGLDTLVEAMGLIAHRKDIELIMMGDGVKKPGLIDMQKQLDANIRFYDYQPVEVAKAAIRSADIGVVTLIPGMYKYAYPSKTMAYLEQGRPIIAMIEEESELAKTMQSEGYGFSVLPGDATALAQLLLRLADESSWKESFNQSASAAFEKYFSSSVLLDKWSKLVCQ